MKVTNFLNIIKKSNLILISLFFLLFIFSIVCAKDEKDTASEFNPFYGWVNSAMCRADGYGNWYEQFDDFEYVESGNRIGIVTYTGKKKDIVIPEKIKGLPVVAIGYYIFSHYGVTSVIIPDSVQITDTSEFPSTQVGNAKDAFSIMIYKNEITIIAYNHNKKNVVIPEKIKGLPVVAIGRAVFSDREFASVVIPDSVKKIGTLAFGKNKITNLILPNSLEKIGDWAFYGNQLTDLVIPNSVKTIGVRAFSYNKLTNVVLPNSVETIDHRAFAGNELEKIIIPNSVRTIGENVFDENVKIIRKCD